MASYTHFCCTKANELWVSLTKLEGCSVRLQLYKTHRFALLLKQKQKFRSQMETAALGNSHVVCSYCLQFSTFLFTPWGPQDLGIGWLWDAALCFMLLLCSQQLSVNWWVTASQMLRGGLVMLSLQVHRGISLDARAKTFYVFPCIYANIHWKEA